MEPGRPSESTRALGFLCTGMPIFHTFLPRFSITFFAETPILNWRCPKNC